MINCIICNVQKISRQMYLTKVLLVYRFSTKLDDGIEDDDDDSSVEKV